MKKQKIITVIGQTASGKSDLGVFLAEQFNGEIISCDSRQIYKDFNLLTGKITKEETKGVKHHLLDIKNFNESFSVAEFAKLCNDKIADIISRGKLPILVGGTMLYTRAITQGFNLSENDFEVDRSLSKYSVDELIEQIKKIDKNLELNESEIKNKQRLIVRLCKLKAGIKNKENNPRYDFLQLAINYPREEIYKRVTLRIKNRIDAGMLEELKVLKQKGASDSFLNELGLDIKHSNMFLNAEYKNYDEYFETLAKETRHFAKRQQSWLNKEPNLILLAPDENLYANAAIAVKNFLDN